MIRVEGLTFRNLGALEEEFSGLGFSDLGAFWGRF